MSTLAIIGTAGRDKSAPLTRALWDWMLADAKARVAPGTHLVSGGAAWADHLAVALFLAGDAPALTLHLPAPFVQGRFVGKWCTSGNTANYYHDAFSRAVGENSLQQIARAIGAGATVTCEPEAPGFHAMSVRNKKVARADAVLAYTFGLGDRPADGGTLDTWKKCRGQRTHVSLIGA